MASRQLFLFATRKDLEPGIRRIESMLPLKYAQGGLFDSPNVPIWKSLLDVDDLGQAHYAFRGRVQHCKAYLVVRQDVEIISETSTQRRTGKVKFGVYQRANPTSIEFTPGGVFDDKHVIKGRIASSSDHPESVQLLREFSRAIIKDFAKEDMYYVGPEAKELHLKGARLITMGIEEKPEYDVVIGRYGP